MKKIIHNINDVLTGILWGVAPSILLLTLALSFTFSWVSLAYILTELGINLSGMIVLFKVIYFLWGFLMFITFFKLQFYIIKKYFIPHIEKTRKKK